MAQCFDFPNIGYLIDEVPKDIFEVLQTEVLSMDSNSNPVNADLAGNIENEADLAVYRPMLEPYILDLMTEYDKRFQYTRTIDCLTDHIPYSLNDLWVNFQKKHEFNPVHNHAGVFSFVIWIKVPFVIEQERQNPSGVNSNCNCSSNFQLLYTNSLGQISDVLFPVDKSWEGTIILFPNKMLHCVYPFFSSDEERISIAGNVLLKSQ